jgi:hypothetical protein
MAHHAKLSSKALLLAGNRSVWIRSQGQFNVSDMLKSSSEAFPPQQFARSTWLRHKKAAGRDPDGQFDDWCLDLEPIKNLVCPITLKPGQSAVDAVKLVDRDAYNFFNSLQLPIVKCVDT